MTYAMLNAAASALSLRHWLTYIMHGAALAVFFFVPWWLRLDLGRSGDPYFVRFLITLPWLLTVILWIALGFGGLGAWRRVWPWLIPWLLLSLWGYISQRWAFVADPAWDSAMQLLAVCAFAVAMATAGPPLPWIAAALGAGLLFQGIIGALQAALQRPLGLQALGEFEIRPGGIGLNVLKVNGVSWLRPYGLTAHPNMLGGFLAVALVCIFALFVWRRQRRVWQLAQAAAIIAGIVGLGGLLVTFSRSAWLGALVGIVALLGLWRWRTARSAIHVIHWQRVWLAFGVGAVLTLVFVITYRPLVFARTGVGDESNELRSISDRALFTEYAIRMISQHPLEGLGIGMNAWAAAQMIHDDPRQIDMQAQSVHNVPLLIWSELGLVGLLLWLVALGGAALIVWQCPNPDPLLLGFVAGVIVLLVIGLFDFYTWGIFQYELLWWGLLGALLHAATSNRPIKAVTQVVEPSRAA